MMMKYVIVPVIINNAENMVPNIDYAKTGTLKRITYPTKGYSEFKYELNTFLLEGVEKPGPGLRISKVIYNDTILLISLDLYLGKEHKFYEFPNYLKENFEERQIMPDVVSSFSYRNIPDSPDRSRVAQMVFEGKQLYAKDLLLPNYNRWGTWGEWVT